MSSGDGKDGIIDKLVDKVFEYTIGAFAGAFLFLFYTLLILFLADILGKALDLQWTLMNDFLDNHLLVGFLACYGSYHAGRERFLKS